MSEHEHDGVIHTHDDEDGRFYGTHTHDGFEHTHDDEDNPEFAFGALPPEGWVLKPATDTEPERYDPPDRDEVDESSDSVEPPAPKAKRQVPVIISGVNHGMRDAEEGE